MALHAVLQSPLLYILVLSTHPVLVARNFIPPPPLFPSSLIPLLPYSPPPPPFIQVAKWVGDIFNHGLYDIHVELNKTPLLGWESPHRMEK